MEGAIVGTVKTVALLVFYIAIGFLLGKKKIVGENAGKTLAAILTWVVMPFYSVVTLSKNVTVEKIGTYGELFLVGIAVAAVSLAICIPLSGLFVKKGYVRNIYKYMFFAPNLGYFGYPLVESVFGGEMLAMYMIFTLPTSVAICTYGYMILTDKNADKIADGVAVAEEAPASRSDFIKRIFGPPMIGTFVGLALGLLSVSLPEVVYEFLSPAKVCMEALAMLLMGIVLSELNFKTLFSSKKAYVFGLIRLLIYPAVFGGITYIMYLFGVSREIFILTVSLTALPAGMNVVVYPESIGLSGREGAQACFISYLMVIATLPLVFAVLSALAG